MTIFLRLVVKTKTALRIRKVVRFRGVEQAFRPAVRNKNKTLPRAAGPARSRGAERAKNRRFKGYNALNLNKKDLSERDICTKFITPGRQQAGWDEMTQIREEV